jgi:hypothetical protein
MRRDLRRGSSTARRWLATATAVTVAAGVLHGVWLVSDVVGPTGATAQAAETDPIRDTEAEARAAAAELGKPVEVSAFRSESRSVFVNPDGTLTSREYARPVRTFRDGRWVGVNDRLVEASDGSFAPQAAVVGIRVSGGGDGPLVSMTKAGRTVSLTWPEKLLPPVVSGDSAKYSEVLPGVDLVVHVDADGFSHSLVVKSADAAAEEELERIDLTLESDGLAVTETAQGGLSLADESAGGTVFEAATPQMWDAGQEPIDAGTALSAMPAATSQVTDVGVEMSDDTLTLVPNQELLTGDDTTYPVVIDPVFKSASRTAWTMIASGYPNEEYWKFDGKAHEGMGSCPVVDGTCNDVNVKRLLYRMSTSAFLGKQIMSAAFHVTLYHAFDGTARPARLYRSGDFTSATNWSNKPDSLGLLDTRSPNNPTGTCTATNQNTEFNATSGVAAAVADGKTTVSFGLRADDENNYRQWKRFCDNAYLEVVYNTPPSMPSQSKMTQNPGGACVYGSSRPYANPEPRLSAVGVDPDDSATTRQKVKMQFKVLWTASDGAAKELPVYTTGWNWSGSTFSYQIPAGAIPENTVISWIARAGDNTDGDDDVENWSGWSWDGNQTRCEFILDKTKPLAPTVSSTDYPSTEDASADGVGVYGTFTFASASTDVVSYRYWLRSNTADIKVAAPAVAGGPVSVKVMPTTDGPNAVHVVAVDSSGSTSLEGVHTFSVSPGRAATGAWSLADAPGSTKAADTAATPHPATAGAGVTFGAAGPGANPAVSLDGSAGAYLTPKASGLVNTGTGFSVAAWVRLADENADRVAVSIDGSGEPGFTLGYSAASKAWRFGTPITDVESLGNWQVLGPKPAVGQWTHLAGVYDQVTGQMTMYVNGVGYASAVRQSPWTAYGSVQIGRMLAKTGYTGHFNGRIADVRVFDRIVVPAEIAALFKVSPKRLAYWPLSTVTGGVSPEAGGGTGLSMAGGSSIYTVQDELLDEPALVGSGHLVLDGVTGHASVAKPVAATGESFTITARVRLTNADPAGSMTVFAETGTAASVVRVRYDAPSAQWQLVVSGADATQPATTTVYDTDTAVAADADGQLLAVVYDAFDHEVRLYVDGVLASTGRASIAKPWTATGFQVGRGLIGGAYGEYLSGAVDDVRIYAGVADQNLIQRIAVREENTAL